MSRRRTLKHQAEVEAEFLVEEEKAAEIKKQVQTANNSPEAQQLRAAAALKDVAEMQEKCSYSVKVQVAESTRAVKNTAWRRIAGRMEQTVASKDNNRKVWARRRTPRSWVRRTRTSDATPCMSREFRTAQKQVKKMTRAKARSEGKFAEQ